MMQATVDGAVDVAEAYPALGARLEQIVRLDVRGADRVVEDACQFAWSRLIPYAPRVPRESALSWLATTAVREAVKLLRRDARELPLADGAAEERPSGVEPALEEVIERRERLELMRRLPRRQQQMLWLQAIGFSYSEIAREEGCSERTVERQLLRAKRVVRAAASEYDDPRRSWQATGGSPTAAAASPSAVSLRT